MIVKNTFQEYRQMEGVNSSFLKRMDVPFLAVWHEENPAPQSPSMLIGDAFHLCMENPLAFDQQYIGMEADLRTKEGKKQKAKIEAEYPSATIVKNDFIDQILDMRATVLEIDAAMKVVKNIPEDEKEFSITWQENGIKCKGRIDAFLNGIIYDYKTTTDLDKFLKDIPKYSYPLQAAHYIAGLKANNIDVTGFCWIVVTTKKPYQAVMYFCNELTLEAGEAERQQKLERYKECVSLSHWPGVKSVQRIDAPSWYLDRYLEL